MARLFDASTEKVDFGAMTDVVPITMFGWIYPTASITGNQQIIGCNDNPSANYWMLRGESTDKIAVRMSFSTTPGSSVSAASTITANTWQFVAGVVTASAIEVYHGTTADNIVSVESTTANPSGTHTDSSENITIGNTEDDNQAFVGHLDNVGWVNAALTLAELKEVAADAEQARSDYGLYAPLWGLHSPELDLSATGASGTVTGATQSDGSVGDNYVLGYSTGESLGAVSNKATLGLRLGLQRWTQ